MKKLSIIVIFILFLSFYGSAGAIISDIEEDPLVGDVENLDFTHTVFAEECSVTWCPNCPIAAEALSNIYDSEDYPFYYVALVDDMNPIAHHRNVDYSLGLYPIYAYPTVYFDGGNTNFVGRMMTVEATENEYRDLIELEGNRIINHPIKLESSVTWDEDAKITVSLTVINEDSKPYFGRIRSYVTEIESRWSDHDGVPFRFAFLDYALNQFIFILPMNTKTITGTFDGNLNHEGNIYQDISKDNIQVISTISHWIPHIRDGYQSGDYNQKYLSFPIDQTIASVPE